MTDPLYQAVCENFAEKVAYVARRLPMMTVMEDTSFLAIDCGLPSDTFNVIVVRSPSAPERAIGTGIEHFRAKRLPVALWYWEDSVNPQGIEPLLAYGLELTETHVAMAADVTVAGFSAPAPRGLTIQPVTRADELRQYGAVIAALFGARDEGHQVMTYFNLLSRYPVNQFSALRSYIGTYKGEVVATGSLFVGQDTTGIYDIVTRDEYRRQGIGSAMFAHLIEEARQFRHRYAVLQASPDGIGIYRKAGFQPVGMVHTFEERAPRNAL